MNALTLSIIGLLITLLGTLKYLLDIPKNKVPVYPVILITSLLLGLGITGLSILESQLSISILSIAHLLISSITALIAFGMLWLLKNRKTPIGEIKVSVGDKLIPFESTFSDEKPFSTDEFKGKRVLLKFFRGAWCPYCSAELIQFNEMKDFFDSYKISVYALSKDSPSDAGIHKKRDGLGINILSDKDLETIKKYGVEHQKAIGGKTNSLKVLGVPISIPYKFDSMAIPTTLIIDEFGIIQWIDQSDDYRLRSNEIRVKESIKNIFDAAPDNDLRETKCQEK